MRTSRHWFTVVAAAAFVASKSEPCLYNGRICRWHGQAPECTGDAPYHVGSVSPNGRELVTSTRYASITDLCANRADGINPGADCCAKYGSGCATGYKRLWCDDEIVAPAMTYTPPVQVPGDGCIYQDKECQWYGDSPFCLATEHKLGSRDDKGREYVASTREAGIQSLCREETRRHKRHCCNTYGEGCASGYKRLWCFANATRHSTQEEEQQKERVTVVVPPPADYDGRATCRLGGRSCEWRGSSPFCGSETYSVGQRDGGNWTLVMTTERAARARLCGNKTAERYPGEQCCRAYAATCWSGYKRLWCSPERDMAYWETDAWKHG